MWVALSGVLAVAVVLLPALGRRSASAAGQVPPPATVTADRVSAGTQPGFAVPTPPAAAVAPGAVAFGADPGVVHFTVGGLIRPVARAAWTVRDGYEQVEADLDGDVPVQVTVSGDRGHLGDGPSDAGGEGLTPQPPQPTSVAGRAGELQRFSGPYGKSIWALTWSPADGVWARAQTYGNSGVDAYVVARALRLGTAVRCGGPLSLALPAGTRWVGCQATLRTRNGWTETVLTLAHADGTTLDVTADIEADGAGGPRPNGTAAGHRVHWPDALSGTFEVPDLDGVHLRVDPGLSADQLTALVAGAQVSPASWAARVVR